VKVLGDVEVEGWLELPRRSVITELAVYLAMHPSRPLSGGELRNALWPETDTATEASAKSLRTYMSELRRLLGADVVPSARGGGYSFSTGVLSDWAMVQYLVGQSLVEGLDSLGQRELLYEALWLVRGRPFSGVNYNWVFSELLLSEIEGTIRRAAIRLFELCIEVGDWTNALFAVRKGLLASPYEQYLWGNALSLSAELGPSDLERTWRECQATLGEQADLEHHFNELVTRGPTSTWTP
jgi:two-component SAPR family response regulator